MPETQVLAAFKVPKVLDEKISDLSEKRFALTKSETYRAVLLEGLRVLEAAA